MKKYYQLLLVVVCLTSVVALLVYRQQYNHLRYVLEVLNFFGKPGGTSESDLCAYGINSSVLSERLEGKRTGLLDLPSQFQRIDDYHYAYSSFWKQSSSHPDLNIQNKYYGISNTIVFGSKHAKQNFRCHFLMESEDRPIIGKFSFFRMESRANIKEYKDYVLFIFHCKLTRPLGSPYAVSFYPNSDTNPYYSPIIKMINLSNGNTHMNSVEHSVLFDNNFKIAACVMPTILPTITRKNVMEFLSFHKLLGITEFHIYDNSLPTNVLEKLAILPTEITGFTVNILPFNFPYSSEDSYQLMRDLAEWDCTFRNLNRNRRFEENDVHSKERISHIVHLSWDEFIVPRYHHFLKPFLGQFELGKKNTKLQLSTLHFCINQRDDSKVNPEYPLIIKKTHYDKSVNSDRSCYIYNIGTMLEKDFSFSLTALQSDGNKDSEQKSEKMSQDMIAIHKYIDCGENIYNHKSVDMDFGDFETRPHMFEGAMIRFGEDLYNSQLYKLFKADKIWPAQKYQTT
ncbi:uncharacterized protein LOC143917846 [Arctopsyche grandis]|uniref:uncharacterized protein LOC143917846 n=1 Tax=Arctopsyche grandis TaxID=121162 RepID=UPI00406D7CAB